MKLLISCLIVLISSLSHYLISLKNPSKSDDGLSGSSGDYSNLANLPPSERFTTIAKSQHGVTEDSIVKNVKINGKWVRKMQFTDNKGVKVDQYLHSVKILRPAPWCAAYVHWCLENAGIQNKITGSVTSIHNVEPFRIIYNSNNFELNRNKNFKNLREGDIITFAGYSHTGIIIKTDWDGNGGIETIEGNTRQPGSTRFSEREGYGVFIKHHIKSQIRMAIRYTN